MAIGRSSHDFCDGRDVIHASSRQTYLEMSRMTDAVCGGTSNANPNGSLFFRIAPLFVRISYLYLCPSGRSGMNISHTPFGTRCRIACTRPSHALKSPMTLTRSAFGAETAK